VVSRGDKENVAPSYLIDKFSRTKIFLVGENVRPHFLFPALKFSGLPLSGPNGWPSVYKL